MLWLQLFFARDRCIFGFTVDDIMRGVLEGHLALEEGGLEGNPHTHRDGSDTLVDVAEVTCYTFNNLQPSSSSVS